MNKRKRDNFQAPMKLIAYIMQGPNKKQLAHLKGAIEKIMLNKDTKIWAGSRTTNYGKAYLG